MAEALKTVRLIANVADNRCKHVNVLTATPALDKNAHPVHKQASGAAPAHEYQEYYVAASGAGPFNNGLLTIIVAGYSGPE